MRAEEQFNSRVLPAEDGRLKTRALRLAKLVNDNELKEHRSWLTFQLEDKTYALESGLLIWAGSYKNMTPLVLHGGLVKGVVNWQGSILGVLDLRKMVMHSQVDALPISGVMLVVGRLQAEWGLAVNQILDLLPLGLADEQQCRLSDEGTQTNGIMLGRLQSKIWLLDGQALLNRMDQLLER